jgi:hypothetical protein
MGGSGVGFRHRLSDISWFMQALSEPIARLACAMYVDLNPVRAALGSANELLSRSAEGVGSRFRRERFLDGSLLLENDSRPGVFHLFGFRLIACFCVDRFLFRFGGRFLRPQRACPEW